MAKDREIKFEAPVGKIYTMALREEANIDERNERYNRAQKLRRLADRIDFLTSMYRKAAQL